MSRGAEYQFFSTSAAGVVAELVEKYEEITGISVQPGSPEKLFIQWAAAVLVQERVLANYAGNQNIPSRAEGENLDALGELFYACRRPEAGAAVCTVRFRISEAQTFAVLIPAGTRVTDSGRALVWQTAEDACVDAGETWADVRVRCQTAGTVGNGYVPGQINTAVDLYDYYSGCENITESEGGADRATDEAYYELLRSSMDGYSTAGARGAYAYLAKQVSTKIADVAVVSPEPCVVKLYVLMEGGRPAGEEMKAAVLASCSADEARPLTDLVCVEDPEQADYDISFTYYVPAQSGAGASGAEIAEKVRGAVDQYAAWQSARLGRDINPSRLIGLLMQTGIKRVDLAAPAFRALDDGSAGGVPQVARLGAVTIRNGGYEHE